MSIHTIGLPNLNRNKQHKSHSLVYTNGYANVVPSAPIGGGKHVDGLAKVNDDEAALLESKTAMMYSTTSGGNAAVATAGLGGAAGTAAGGAAAAAGQHVPSYVAYDKLVLRFEGFFKETVDESNDENYRVRRVDILYYMEDDSIGINEKKVINSGIPQGTFLKRHLVPIPGGQGEHYTFHDLDVGAEIVIYGRTFRITNADKFTRDFYAQQGMALGAPERVPDDPYIVKRENADVKPSTGQVKGRDAYAQFLEHDGDVLAFYALWDDSDNLYGEQRKFLIQYFLADDTVEVNEQYKPNCGYDPYPKFFRRNKLNKKSRLPLPGEPIDFVKAHELIVGETIQVAGRPMLLFDCSEQTRKYYADVHGIEQGRIELPEEKKPEPKHSVPPPTGFGSEEDSLGSVNSLAPKPPRKNVQKLMELEKTQLRFSARMETNRVDDQDRRFVVTYYLADDTVLVFEPPQRNSGIKGGKFLERKRLKRPDGQYFEPSDFYVGAKVVLLANTFILLDTDSYSLNYMEGNPEQFPACNIKAVVAKLRAAVAAHGYDMQAVFDKIDSDNSGQLSTEEFGRMIAGMDLGLSEQEILTLKRKFDTDGSGEIAFKELRETMDGNDSYLEAGEKYYDDAPEAADDPAAQMHVAKIMDIIREKIHSRKPHIRDTFREMDVNKDSKLSLDEMRAGLDLLGVTPPPHLVELVLAKFFWDEQAGKWNDIIDYSEWVEALWEKSLDRM